MENKDLNQRMELSPEDLDHVTGAGIFDFLEDLGKEIIDAIENLFD